MEKVCRECGKGFHDGTVGEVAEFCNDCLEKFNYESLTALMYKGVKARVVKVFKDAAEYKQGSPKIAAIKELRHCTGGVFSLVRAKELVEYWTDDLEVEITMKICLGDKGRVFDALDDKGIPYSVV